MTARAFEETPIEEGFASLDAYESSVVPIEHAGIEQTVADVHIDAAQMGITLLGCLIAELHSGTTPTVTLYEIGAALMGASGKTSLLSVIFERDAEIRHLKEAIVQLERIAERYSRVQPNWREKVSLAKDQDKLLRATTRLVQLSLATLENELYATRVANASQYLEDALVDLDDYKMEGDPVEALP